MSCAARALTFSCRAIIGAVTSGLESTNSARAGRRALDFSFWQRRRKRASASASRSSSSSPARAAAWMAPSAAPIRVVRSWLCRRSRGDGAQTDVQAGQVGERFAALAQQVGDQQRSEPVLVFERLSIPPRLVSDGRRKGRRQLARRFDLASPIGEPAGLVEILVVDQRAGGVRGGLNRRRRGAGSFSQQPRRAFDGGVDFREFFAERVDVGDGERGGLFLRRRFAFSAQVVEAAAEKAARRGAGDAPARPQHRMRAGQFVGGRAQIHFGVVEDEVFEVDEFAGEPEAGAGVVKMRAGAKTVAQGAGAQALVEAGEGVLGGDDGRHEADVEARCDDLGQGEFGPLGGCFGRIFCGVSH